MNIKEFVIDFSALRKRGVVCERQQMVDGGNCNECEDDDPSIEIEETKILGRLGASVASSMADATHFIADQFVRTRNMLEAIASGKPVVTHLWLESCGQANCFIDEKNYIQRDSMKEREFGFSMPSSLARACQYPLLKDWKVFITPNTKPGKETISSLVKAVKGQVAERIGRSALTADQIPDPSCSLQLRAGFEWDCYSKAGI